MEQNFEDATDTGEMEITEDYIVLDDVAGTSHLDLSNLRKRKTKIISSAKETIENGECIKVHLSEIKSHIKTNSIAYYIKALTLPHTFLKKKVCMKCVKAGRK